MVTPEQVVAGLYPRFGSEMSDTPEDDQREHGECVVDALRRAGFHVCAEGEGVVGGQKVILKQADVWDVPSVAAGVIEAAEDEKSAAYAAISDNPDDDGTWLRWCNASERFSMLVELSERTGVYYKGEERPYDAVPLYRCDVQQGEQR